MVKGTEPLARLAALAACAALGLAACGGPPAEPGDAAPGDATAAPASRSGGDPRAESVLLITVDTLRADAPGYAGGPPGVTPAIDHLAAGGRRFHRAHAHAVLTLPAHASILTGLYPYQHGVRDNGGYVLAPSVPTLAGRLAGAGFATAAFVAAFPLDSRFGLDAGFALYDDRYREVGPAETFLLAERPGGEVVGPALAWWRENAGRRRFLWVHLFEPHAPYEPPEPFAGRFAEAPYFGEVAAADAALAPLLEPFLEGRETGTLVVLTADHGEGLGEHGEATHGLFAYQSTLRVPLVLFGPGVETGDDHRLARHVDLAPSILEAAGLAAAGGGPEPPGRSLLAPAEEPATSYFEALHAALNRGWAPLRGTVAGGLKYIELPLPELYDLEADPEERDNRVAERRRDAGRLDRLLPEERPWPPAAGAVTAADAQDLAALGYLAGGAGRRDGYTAADDPKNLVEVDRKMHLVLEAYARRELAEAERLGREVLAGRPEMPPVWALLAQVLVEAGRLDEALALMEEAIGRDLATDSLLRQYGLTLAWTGRAERAVEVLRPLAAGGDPAAVDALGTALLEAGRPEEAIAVLGPLLARDPDDAQALDNLTVAQLALGRWPEAERHARRTLEVDPRRPSAWNHLGVARYRQGDGAGALAAWERSLELAPEQLDTLFNLGVKAAELGRPERAETALRRFVSEAPPARYGRQLEVARDLLRRLETAS